MSDNDTNRIGARITRSGASTTPDEAERLRTLARRLQTIENEAAAVHAELLDIAATVHAAASATQVPAVPVLAYTMEQVGEAIGLRHSSVSKLVGSGAIPIVRPNGGHPRVLVSDLVAYLDSLREQS